MLLSTVAAGCIYGECIQLGCTSSLSCFCVGLFLVLLANQQILFFLFVWLALWVLCSLPTCMSLCLGSLLPVSLCVSNTLVLPLVCISDMYFLHLFYCPFYPPKIGGWLPLLLLVCCRDFNLWRLFLPVVRMFLFVPYSYLRPGVPSSYGFGLGVFVFRALLAGSYSLNCVVRCVAWSVQLCTYVNVCHAYFSARTTLLLR
jgi:hypothetical protein